MASSTRRDADLFFLLTFWVAADAARACRQAADDWRGAGSVDYAAELEQSADAHDALWDGLLRARHDAGRR